MKSLLWFIALLGLLPTLAPGQNVADTYYDPAAMAKARAQLKSGHGNQIVSLILGERLEVQSNGGDALTVWEAQGWIGVDEQKFWLKTEGEYAIERGQFEETEVQLLYSRAVLPFWDLQAGFRRDSTHNRSRAYAVFGAQGLAPYWFELDTQLFLSESGDLSLRLEAEYEFRLTQRLFVQPRVEVNAAFSSDRSIGVGSGLSTAQAGLRLRYEVRREFAPYIGVSWQRAVGETGRFRRRAGEEAGGASLAAGIRFWF